MKKQTNNTTGKFKNIIKNKKTIRALLLIAIVFVVMFICTITNWLIQSISYSSYTKKMNYYGYNELYTNKKATAFQKVTNIDMLRVIIGSLNNVTDIKEIALVPELDKITEDEAWYETAKVIGLASNIESKDLKKKANEMDAVISIVKVLEAMLDIKIETTKLNISEKKLKDYSNTDREYISKAVTIGLIENKDSEVSNSSIIKGKLNKLIIQVVSKYATLHPSTTTIDASGNVVKNDVYLVTEKEQLPKNDDEYPYIVSNIEKEVYEMEFNIVNKKNFKEPKEVYKTMGKLYGQISEIISNYFDTLLNVDYNNINERDFAEKLNRSSINYISKNDVLDYVGYVKKNKIILKGQAEPLLPIIYDNGEGYVVRTKIEFEVLNSETDKNLLYKDSVVGVQYKGKKIVMYVDLPMGITLNSNSLLVNVTCNANNMVKTNENVIVGK